MASLQIATAFQQAGRSPAKPDLALSTRPDSSHVWRASFRSIGRVARRTVATISLAGFAVWTSAEWFPAHAQTGFQTLVRFGVTNRMICSPQATLIEGQDGALYGTSSDGGSANGGTAFRINKDGTGLSVIKHFGEAPTDGFRPTAPLLEGKDGALYGSTPRGGESDNGTLFTVQKDGGGFRILKTVVSDGQLPEWAEPTGALIEGSDGSLYGTSRRGGGRELGSVFRLDKDGTNFRLIWRFTGTPGDGAFPAGALLEGSDGRLYGTTAAGGTMGLGTVFALEKTGDHYTVLWNFEGGSGGHEPQGGLVQGMDGTLFGTTQGGDGIIFALSSDGATFRTLKRFVQDDNGPRKPRGGLLQAPGGQLYGVTAAGGSGSRGVVFSVGPDGSGFATLQDYPLDGVNGAIPAGPPIVGKDGFLYGATERGGLNDWGTVFRMKPDGADYTVLFRFSRSGADGVSPNMQLLEGVDGALYGNTREGGVAERGTVFRLNRDGSGYVQLRSFSGGVDDGSYPTGGLVRDVQGILYGATRTGGTADRGTIFRLDPDGRGYAVLKHFPGGAEGSYPVGLTYSPRDNVLYGAASTVFKINTDGSGFMVLRTITENPGGQTQAAGTPLQGSDGMLYGMTGGDGDVGAGTVYRLSASGMEFSVLHNFGIGDGDGRGPRGTLIEAPDGMLYGTTSRGGTAAGQGTIFRMSKDGTGYQVLRAFRGDDGSHPYGGLVQRSDGALYGTADEGGVVFKLLTDGSAFGILRLVDFGASGGTERSGALMVGSDGALYGTTSSAGGGVLGTVFRLNSFEPNRPPVVGTAIEPQTLMVGTPFSLTLPADAFVEPDSGQRLSYRVTLRDQTYLPAWLNFDPVSLTLSGVPSERNVVFIQVVAKDDWAPALSASQSFPMSILNPNHPPAVNRPIPDLEIRSGDSISYTFPADTFIDPDPGDQLLYDVSAILNGIALPPGLLLPGLNFNSTSRTFSGTALSQPSSTVRALIQVVARDTGSPRLTATNSFWLSIVASPTNHPPAVVHAVDDQSARLGMAFNLRVPDGTFEDRDPGQALTYQAAGLPDGISFDPRSGVLDGVPTRAGVFVVQLTATDSGSPPLSTTTRFNISVHAEIRILTVRRTESGSIQLHSQGTPGFTYAVQTCDSLISPPSWAEVGRVMADSSGYFNWSQDLLGAGSSRFFRVAVP